MSPAITRRRPHMPPAATHQSLKAVATVANAISWSRIEVASDDGRPVAELGRFGQNPVPYRPLVRTVLLLRERGQPETDHVHAGALQHHVQGIGGHGRMDGWVRNR